MSEISETISKKTVETAAWERAKACSYTKSGGIRGWLTKKHSGFWNWTIAFVLILGGGVISGFVFNGRSLVDEWSLLATQLFVTSVFALPAGFLVSRLAKGCIVCRDENIETDE